MLSRDQDAYGRLIHDHYRGVPSVEIIERDDGWFGVSAGAPAYFAPCRLRGVRDARVLPFTRTSPGSAASTRS